MKTLKTTILFALTIAFGATAWAASYTWDGGGDGTTFDDAANWTPAGSAFNTVDDYLIDNGSSVSVTGTLSIASFHLAGSGENLTIDSGASLTINANAQTNIDSNSTLTIDGTLTTGANRYDIRGNGGTVNIIVNGTLDSDPANNGLTDGANVLMDVYGSMDFGLRTTNPFGRILGGGQREHIISIHNSGLTTLQRELIMQADNGHNSAIRLLGGDLDMGAESFTYSNLDLTDPDNGIIFQDAGSSVILDGDQTTIAQGWITDGAVSSTAGGLVVQYDSVGDQTTIFIPEPTSMGLVALSSALLLGLRRRRR